MLFSCLLKLVLAAPVALESHGLESALASAGSNRLELEAALEQVPSDQRAGLTWLLTHMPEEDRRTLSADFLLENVGLAYDAWTGSPWRDEVSEEVFFDAILDALASAKNLEKYRSVLEQYNASFRQYPNVMKKVAKHRKRLEEMSSSRK